MDMRPTLHMDFDSLRRPLHLGWLQIGISGPINQLCVFTYDY